MVVNDARLGRTRWTRFGEWEVGGTGERVELACVVMRPAAEMPPDVEPLDVVRPELFGAGARSYRAVRARAVA